jgi:hypothetical protein
LTPETEQGEYDLQTIKPWLEVFLMRFFELGQFKHRASECSEGRLERLALTAYRLARTYAIRIAFRSLMVLPVVLFCALGLQACTTLITPRSAPSDPVNVFIVDHGRTSSLVVPAPDGDLLRYAYGDWNWYALGRTTIWRGIAALLWPTQSGLGRGDLKGPGTIARVRQQIPFAEHIYSLPVERADLLTFERKMETLYDSRRDTEVSNPSVGLSFVHHPRPYTYFWNSNHAVASWARELGCTTRGLSFGANWQVAPQPDSLNQL